MSFFSQSLLLSLLISILDTSLSTPSPPLYYNDQLVDHLLPISQTSPKWTQRYYASSKHFAGPGSPIFLVLGGEGEIKPETGLFYPFVNDDLANHFSAFVLQPEHRFYGESQPLTAPFPNDDLTRLLTSEQAMYDAIRLLTHVRRRLGCSERRDSLVDDYYYCPVITVGGSYPGFLSASMRLLHPDIIDASYAASAPIRIYAQQVPQHEYYDQVTRVAEKSSPGCADAVKRHLVRVADDILRENSFRDVAERIGFCVDTTLPSYIQSNEMFRDEVMMIVGYTFANYNMQNYPPTDETKLHAACRLFQNTTLDSYAILQRFLSDVFLPSTTTDTIHLRKRQQRQSISTPCLDMSTQLPSGPNATISSGDWSGVGTQWDGAMWDFQTCSLLVEPIGFSPESMFPFREWSMDWLDSHCRSRFRVTPRPYQLVNQWGFDDLVKANASRILFTNGMNDGWFVGAVKENLSDSILVLNFENGAHHSDLSHEGSSLMDTEDIRVGHDVIREVLGGWLEEMKNGAVKVVESV